MEGLQGDSQGFINEGCAACRALRLGPSLPDFPEAVSRVIFDIETVGKDFDALDPETREYFLRWSETEEEVRKVKESLSFYPLTGEIVAIGMLNPEKMRGAVYFQAPGGSLEAFEEDGVVFQPGTEADILQRFWDAVRSYDQFVTFNGRSFDCPFIMVRSAVHRIRPARDLMPNRYNGAHLDLLDQLTFFGATRRFSLDMWCRTLGIRSPKAGGITGYDVKDLFRGGRYEELARYCLGDVLATKEILNRWEQYIRFTPGRSRGEGHGREA